jgi:ubiquinone/menaquinone biosynthesis C-methylase UbiE
MKHFITRFLNIVASFYDPFLKLTMDEQKFRQQIIELANLRSDERVLDIGCGTGTLDLMLAETLNSGSVHGIDVAPKMIEVARKKLLFHHLNFQEKGKTLREISRVLKEDGKYIAAEFGQFPDNLFHGIILKFSRSSGLLHGLYPTELIGQNSLSIEKETDGPLIGRDHKVIYRVLKKDKNN